jgi:hypothetical protein
MLVLRRRSSFDPAGRRLSSVRSFGFGWSVTDLLVLGVHTLVNGGPALWFFRGN